MTISAPSKTEAARQLLALDTTPGLPRLPHIPASWSYDAQLTPEQQEANLLHVALWIVERDQANFDMRTWHKAWLGSPAMRTTDPVVEHHHCGTVHCIAGFAQAMAGAFGFLPPTRHAGRLLLGPKAAGRFYISNPEGLAFLKEVIARNS